LNTIKHILSRYTAFLWGILAPLGVWGVFVISAMDAAAVGLPMDLVIAGYVYKRPSMFLVYCLMGAAGSALGSCVLYWIGYQGGEKLLRKKISEERFAKIHRSFDRHEFWALMFPAMLPPPTPFKLFVLAAAVFEMRFSHFLLAIFAGRFVRFLALSLLTIKFGPQFVQWSGRFVGENIFWILGAIAEILAIWWVVRKVKEKKRKNQTVGFVDGAENN
jgi:membrane protein YqaA with SNARE-associated domain